jgi:hypothetical protein
MTVKEIKKTMTDTFISSPDVIEKYGLQAGKTFEEQFSAVSIESILFYAFAFAGRLLSQMFERHKLEVEQILRGQTSGTAAWYAYKARQFRFGMSLAPETDYYDSTGLTDEQIEAARVVKYAAAIEARDRSVLYLKVAGGTEDNRHPLSDSELAGFKDYLGRVQYAGVAISLINDPPDEMRLSIDIYYSPMLLDETGKRLDGTGNTPVQDAVRNYLNNLPFNGIYTNQGLVDVLQAVPGVDIAEIKSAASRYGFAQDFTAINAREIAHAGYYAVPDANLALNFIANEELL